jgi:hypothetical protein
MCAWGRPRAQDGTPVCGDRQLGDHYSKPWSHRAFAALPGAGASVGRAMRARPEVGGEAVAPRQGSHPTVSGTFCRAGAQWVGTAMRIALQDAKSLGAAAKAARQVYDSKTRSNPWPDSCVSLHGRGRCGTQPRKTFRVAIGTRWLNRPLPEWRDTGMGHRRGSTERAEAAKRRTKGLVA